MSIKLVAIDIDGTLLNSQHKITHGSKKQKRSRRSYCFMYRPSFARREEQLDELALYGENDFVITYNGSLVQTTKIIRLFHAIP